MADPDTIRAAFARDPVLTTAALYNVLIDKYGAVEESFTARDGTDRIVKVPALTLDEVRGIAQVYITAGHAGAILAGGGKHRADVEKQTRALEMATAQERPGLLWDEIFRLAIALNASHGGKTTAEIIMQSFKEEGPRAPMRVLTAVADATEAILRRAARGAGRVLNDFGLGLGGIGTVILIGLGLYLLSQRKGV